jgi:HTH-type transcriptional regulator / antitoxin HigA
MKALSHEEYWNLVERFPLRPLRSDRELKQAVAIVDELIVRPKRSRDADDYLQVLGGLVERYEDEHYPMPDATESEMLEHLIEARGITQRAVAAGTRMKESLVSELRAGRRNFNRNHRERLAKYFNVSPAVFFPNPKTKTRK